jgi:hypothetical protein
MKTVFLLLALLYPVLAQAQSISVQWTRLHPQGFEAVKDWAALPKKSDPEKDFVHSSASVNDDAGWVAAVKIGNRIVYGCDHYAVLQFTASVRSYCWRDDAKWYSKTLGAEVCDYDLNATRCTSYGTFPPFNKAEPNLSTKQFQLPADSAIRHGKYVSSFLWAEHVNLWPKVRQ